MDTLLEILIDNSNSMGPFGVDKGDTSYLLPDGSTRMELAKKTLIEGIVPTLDYANKITIRKFHSEDKTNSLIIETIYDGELDKVAVINKIASIEIPISTGGTPITQALKQVIDTLAANPNADRKIILVTDGQENKGGNYKKATEEALKQYGIPCNIFIVGILQSPEAEEKAKVLAHSTGGAYVNLVGKVYNSESLRASLQPIYKKAITTSVQNFSTINQKSNETATTITPETPRTPEKTILKENDNYNQILKQTQTAFNLISKQLSTINDAIDTLKKNEITEDEVEITENQELNEKIRIASESYLFGKLKEKFGSRVKWVNEQQESGLSYDFEILDTIDNTTEYYIECKASMHPDKVFLLTKKEWSFFMKNKNKYQLYFVSTALTAPQITKVDNLMDWILGEKILPLSTKNIRLKADRIVFTIV